MPWPLRKVDGPSAYIRAAATMSSAGTPQIPAATAGVNCAARPASSSKPWHHALDERLVVRPSADQHVRHGKRQGRVGADARRQPQVRDLRRLRALGVDRDDARAALLGGLQRRPLDGIGDRRVAPDDQRAARVVDVLAARDVEARDAGADRAAAAAQVLVDHEVGRADRAQHQGEDHAAAEIGAAGRAHDRLRPVAAAHLGEAGRPSRPAPRPRRCAPTCPRRARPPRRMGCSRRSG